MNEQRKIGNVRIKSSGAAFGRFPIIGRAEKPPARSHTKSSGRTRLMLPTDAALHPGRGFMIRLAWIRLFHAIVSENDVPPT
jgi:hypothetical protein